MLVPLGLLALLARRATQVLPVLLAYKDRRGRLDYRARKVIRGLPVPLVLPVVLRGQLAPLALKDRRVRPVRRVLLALLALLVQRVAKGQSDHRDRLDRPGSQIFNTFRVLRPYHLAVPILTRRFAVIGKRTAQLEQLLSRGDLR